VAFEFLDTRVFGVGWPGYRNFAELNLRFYVRRGDERGVVFVREFVPQRFVAWMARWLYNEPYLAAPISVTKTSSEEAISLHFLLKFAGRENHVRVTGGKPAFRPGDDSLEHYFKEEHWGYGVTRGGKPLKYEVSHPVWDVFPVRAYELDFDFGAVYGAEWAFLATQKPYSVALAAGSEIAVSPKRP
jgi:uncharacterized protein YqjF (DUF2071 family)